MDEHRPNASRRGPVLLCAGTDPAVAAHLAEVAACLLADRQAIVLAAWQPPALAGLDALAGGLHDAHAGVRATAREAAAEAAHAACEVLEAHGLKVTPTICPEDRAPWQVVLEIADEHDAAAIVAGTSEGAAAPGALGSQARALAHRCRRPLLLVPPDALPAAPAAPAIFAYDGSPPAGRAVAAAAALLRRRPALVASVWHSTMAVVGVASIALPDEVARRGAANLDDAARLQARGLASAGATMLSAAGWACETGALETARGVPAAIVGVADDRDAAIVVTGTRGRSRIAAALLGSNAEAIVRHAQRPVLLVPPAEQTP